MSFSQKQVDLVQQYMPLANSLAHSFYYSGRKSNPFEDYQAEAYFALTEASLKYDGCSASFYTYAKCVMTNHLISVYCKKNKGQEVTFSELDELHDHDESFQDYCTSLFSEDDGYQSVEFTDKVKHFLSIISEQDRSLFLFRAEGKSQTEIARLLRAHPGAKRRYHQPDISEMLQDLKKKYVTFLINC